MSHALQQLVRCDAGETAVFARSLEHVRTQVVQAEFPQFKIRDLVPAESGVDAGAESFVWYFFTQTGVAKMIAVYATDFPYVNEFGSKNITPIESIGCGYQYNLQEVRGAAKAGYQLEARRGKLCREAIERLTNYIGAHGDATRNVPGLLTNSNVPLVTTGFTGNWDAPATAAHMYDDLMIIAAKVWTQSKQIHKATTMVLGTTSYKMIASTPYSTLNAESVLTVFLRTNPWGITQIIPWVEMDLADAQGDGERILAYELSPENLGLVNPIEYEEVPPQAENLNFKVPAHARVGGVVIYRPLAFVYVDGIND
jgi:hypothetical protein